MTDTVNLYDAKTNLSKLVDRAAAGEEIIIARGKEPVVRLSPVGANRRRPVFGALKGKLSVPDSFFFDPLPDEELGLWESVDEGSPR